MPVLRTAAVTVALLLGLAVAPAVAAPGGVGRAVPPPGWVPTETAHRDFLAAVGTDLLGRAPTTAEHQRWLARIEAGGSRTTFAREMTRTRAHSRLVVDRLFLRILGRAPDAVGREHWAGRIIAGLSTASLASRLYASAEFSPLGAGQEAAFVDRMYLVALGRPADEAGRAHWVARLQGGEHRTVMARQFFLAPESNALRVRAHFIDLLRRPPDPAARAHWTEQLRSADDRELEAALVGSDEYLFMAFEAVHGYPGKVTLATHAITAGNGPSDDPAVSGDGRLVVFSSTATDLVPGDANGHADVFLVDLVTQRTRRLTSGDGDSTDPDISPDGTAVAFTSTATDLVAGDANGHADVFHLDLATGTVTQVTGGDGPSGDPSLDGGGTHVAFSSTATDLVAGEDGPERDVFVATAGDGWTVDRIDPGGAPVTESRAPHIAADGSTLVFDVVTPITVDDQPVDRIDAVLAPLVPAGPPVRISAAAPPDRRFQAPDDERGPSGDAGPMVDGDGSTVMYGNVVHDVASAIGAPYEVDGVPQSNLLVSSPALADDGDHVAIHVGIPIGRPTSAFWVLDRAAEEYVRRCITGGQADISADGGVVAIDLGDQIAVCR